jgi:hypothetical protein
VLLYHVAKGRLPAAKVVKRSSIKTLNGKSVSVRVRSGKVYVAGARVVTPDVKASNGVIHVINKGPDPQLAEAHGRPARMLIAPGGRACSSRPAPAACRRRSPSRPH